jgi:uncharacterized membrane protein
MAFCPNCGSAVEGTFCAKCGTSVSGGGPAPGAGPAQGYGAAPGYQAPPPGVANTGMSENMASALCYLFTIVTGVLFLVLAPYNQNRTIRFHAFQAIFFFVSAFIVGFGMFILSLVLGFLPVVGWIISLLIHICLWLGYFIVWLLLMYKAYNNEMWVLPIIGPLAQKQA